MVTILPVSNLGGCVIVAVQYYKHDKSLFSKKTILNETRCYFYYNSLFINIKGKKSKTKSIRKNCDKLINFFAIFRT